ncbi:MAG: energy transducer TonB [Candidatus Marinimicrobia bacterium]|jgi:periplasmic protein TonB|nr:energy transducer TonB [Candidatus Neomarinimicrobiota bacterium]MBT3632949.1 energy transducer TonB [Candidatus Neomarinimicrobiota bacterium]MBT3682059.1 energy transducer TonB [Candidatus Neomarinimicrobiota bacterium]MBT3758912.1 energy transducer TonB [Candidatus Neomarinimicrobiota bacterium]MBT3895189.1 energy transducer TonB [Candidatus Neomarinimicrobiota bacterium]
MLREDPLLTSYPTRLRSMAVYVIIAISLVMYLFPRFLDEAKKLDRDQIVENIETVDIPQTEQFKIPEPPSRPSIPIASDEEFDDEDITLDEMDFDDFDDWATPPPPPSDDGPKVKFIPYDKAPEPIGGYGSLKRNVVYPDIAMEAGIEGTVIIQAFINDKGVVTDWVIMKGIPNTGLDEAAIEAIKKTRWKPALQRDRKVGVWISIPINFSLKAN